MGAKTKTIKPNKNVIPSLLAYSRSISPSGGVFKTFDSNDENKAKQHLLIKEAGVIGTASTYDAVTKVYSGKGSDTKNPSGSQPITADTCYIPFDHDSISLQFTVAFSRESKKPHVCGDREFGNKMVELTKLYGEKGGYELLAERYLKNIFNAKVLWRNNSETDLTVTVDVLRQKDQFESVTCDHGDGFEKLVALVGSALNGEGKRVVLSVEVTAWIGNGQEVFPSQEYIDSESVREKHPKSRVLARTEIGRNKDIAAMHSQKIGNAIR